jgi:hypothetical protein
MSTTLTTDSRLSHPPQLDERPLESARRVGLLDRAALHLGLALIKWGRRPGAEFAKLERRATRVERALLHREVEPQLARGSRLAETTFATHQRLI